MEIALIQFKPLPQLYVQSVNGLTMLGKIFGVICLVMGLILGSWIGYNLFIEALPATEGRSPVPAIGLTAVFFYVAYSRLKPQKLENS